MGSYLQQLQRQVRQQWIPGMTQNSRQTVVFFTVTRSGQVTNLRIVRPSGSSTTDTAAVGAIRRAAPFAPLPSGFAYNSLKISFTFNINVSGGLDLWVR
jgi:TonB family protein